MEQIDFVFHNNLYNKIKIYISEDLNDYNEDF